METKTTHPHEVHGFDLVGLTVRDAKKTIAFYRDVLGLHPAMTDERGAEFELSDGATFGIWQPDEGTYPPGWGVLFAVRDIHEAVSAMRERGADLSDPMETPVCFMSFGKDPEGNAFAIHQRKAQSG